MQFLSFFNLIPIDRVSVRLKVQTNKQTHIHTQFGVMSDF